MICGLSVLHSVSGQFLRRVPDGSAVWLSPWEVARMRAHMPVSPGDGADASPARMRHLVQNSRLREGPLSATERGSKKRFGTQNQETDWVLKMGPSVRLSPGVCWSLWLAGPLVPGCFWRRPWLSGLLFLFFHFLVLERRPKNRAKTLAGTLLFFFMYPVVVRLDAGIMVV